MHRIQLVFGQSHGVDPIVALRPRFQFFLLRIRIGEWVFGPLGTFRDAIGSVGFAILPRSLRGFPACDPFAVELLAFFQIEVPTKNIRATVQRAEDIVVSKRD